MAARLTSPVIIKRSSFLHPSRWQCAPWWANSSLSPIPMSSHIEKRRIDCSQFARIEYRLWENYQNPSAAGLSEQSLMMYAVVPSLCVVLPASVSAAVPTLLLPGSLADCSFRWVFESFAHIGPVTMGLPGLVSLTIFLNPMLEAISGIIKSGDVGKLPMLPYSAMAAQGLVWTFYGVLVENPAIWTPNICALLLGLSYCGVYARHCPPSADWLPYKREYHAAGLIATALMCSGMSAFLPTSTAIVSLGFLGNIMTMTMFGGPLAAMRTVVKERCTKSLPLGFTCAVFLNCNLWFFYAYFMIDDPFIYLQDGIGLLLTTAQIALFVKYGIYELPFPRKLWGIFFKEAARGK